MNIKKMMKNFNVWYGFKPVRKTVLNNLEVY